MHVLTEVIFKILVAEIDEKPKLGFYLTQLLVGIDSQHLPQNLDKLVINSLLVANGL